MKKKAKIKTSEVIYDSFSDTLTARFNDRNTLYSINMHDILIIDLSSSNRIAGIEILDVSDIFDLKEEDLKEIKGLILKIIYNEDTKELLVKTSIEFINEDKNCNEIIVQPLQIENPITV